MRLVSRCSHRIHVGKVEALCSPGQLATDGAQVGNFTGTDCRVKLWAVTPVSLVLVDGERSVSIGAGQNDW